jgi:hypothetical protein
MARALLPDQYMPHEALHYIQNARIPSVFDNCLASDRELWNAIMAEGIDRVCCPKGRAPYSERPWIFQPDSGRPLREIGSKLVSALTLDSTNQVILQFPIPIGYDGVIDSIVCGLTANGATGFLEGSGDIVWRLAAITSSQPRYLRDLGNILFSQGSLLTPTHTLNGLRVYSGDLVTFFAALPPTTLISPAATVVCACMGWIYSR